MATEFEVPPDKLAWRCDLSFLPFTCTADMTPLEDFIGQERAVRAIQFGLGVNKPGFNIFVTGLTGTGKTSIIKAFLKRSPPSEFRSMPTLPSPMIGATFTTLMILIGLKCLRSTAAGAKG